MDPSAATDFSPRPAPGAKPATVNTVDVKPGACSGGWPLRSMGAVALAILAIVLLWSFWPSRGSESGCGCGCGGTSSGCRKSKPAGAVTVDGDIPTSSPSKIGHWELERENVLRRHSEESKKFRMHAGSRASVLAARTNFSLSHNSLNPTDGSAVLHSLEGTMSGASGRMAGNASPPAPLGKSILEGGMGDPWNPHPEQTLPPREDISAIAPRGRGTGLDVAASSNIAVHPSNMARAAGSAAPPSGGLRAAPAPRGSGGRFARRSGAVVVGPRDDPSAAIAALSKPNSFVALVADWCGNCRNLKAHAAADGLADFGEAYLVDEAHKDRVVGAIGVSEWAYPLVKSRGKVVIGHDPRDAALARFR